MHKYTKSLSIGVYCFAALLFMPASFAQNAALNPTSLDFKEFCEKVIAHYPKLKAQNADVALGIAKKMQAAAGFFPRIQATASYSQSDDPVYVFSTLLKQGDFSPSNFAIDSLNNPHARTNLQFGLHMQIPLFDAFQTILKLKSSKMYLSAAEDTENFTKQEAILIAQDAFTHALVLDALLTVTEEVLIASQEDIKKAQDLKDKGMVLGADFYAAKTMQGNFKRMHNELSRQKKAMMILLDILMGEDTKKEFSLKGELKEFSLNDMETQTLIEQALQNRLDYRALTAQSKAYTVESKREKLTIMPKVSAFASMEENRRTLSAHGSNNYIAGVKGELPLDPTYPGRVKEAAAQAKKAEAQVGMLKDSIAGDIAKEHARFGALLDNTPVVSDMAKDAKEALNLTIPLYNEGRKSIADLLEMRFAFLNTMSAYYNTLSSLQMSNTRLLFLSGQLNTNQIAQIIKQIGG